MSQSSETFTQGEMLTVMRNSFYEGAQYLYNEHFTTVHPFPSREVMNKACERFPGRALRHVTINGMEYRVNGKVIEIHSGAVNRREWIPATAITPEAVKVLADLIDNPYEVAK